MDNTITNKDNVVIKEYRKLKDKKWRVKSEKFLVEGLRFTEEALNSNFEVEALIINETFKKIDEIKEKCNKNFKNVKKIIVSPMVFSTLTDTENSQGIISVVKNKNVTIEDRKGFYILVDRIQDPGNLGTIIRSAHASGALGVILRKGTVDIYNEKTLRSTMGSIFHIPIIVDDDYSKIMELKENGFKLLVSSLQTNNNFYDLNLKDKVIITVGNEGNGVEDTILSMADDIYKIPMPGGAESLNAAVSASIMMFEIVRQNTANR